jgi:hypothetical protein
MKTKVNSKSIYYRSIRDIFLFGTKEKEPNLQHQLTVFRLRRLAVVEEVEFA